VTPASRPFGLEVEALVRATLAGERPAAEQLLRRLLPRIRNLVRYLVRDDRDVDDIAQEVLVLVYRRLETYDGRGGLSSWVDRIATRATFAARRKERSRREVFPSQPEIVLAAADDSERTRPDEVLDPRRLVRLLAKIPEEQRDALVMHHALGWSVPEIATELSASPETVRSRLRLGRAHLRALMNDGES
jgi:RNA polymerase sigma-70 factor (ECF subfamily)